MSNFAGCYKPLGYEVLVYKKRGNEIKKERRVYPISKHYQSGKKKKKRLTKKHRIKI
jgi:hypothetical protein